LNWLKTLKERDKDRKKKNRGDEPNQAMIHINMEASLGNLLSSYLKHVKMSVYFLLYNWRTGGQNKNCQRELILVGRGRR
jgi:hypothetical protein